MGLSICRSIIDAHGGRVWASRNTGPGMTFQFTISAWARSGLEKGINASAPPRTDLGQTIPD
jgi:K+-sensing histidine kinase KdpD